MRYCQILILISGVAFTLYGLYCLFNPTQLAANAFAIDEASAALRSELYAVYGGLQIWAGVLLLVPLWQSQWLQKTMFFYLTAFLAMVLPRTAGAVIDGNLGDSYVSGALLFEWGTVVAFSFGLWLLRRSEIASSA